MAAGQRPTEIKALAGARALPPLLLVLYHFGEGHHYMHIRVYDLFIAKGYLWVEFFFVLSGFILTYVYHARGSFWRWDTYSTFLKTRLARLYPLHLFMLLLILVMVIYFRWLAQVGGYVSYYDAPYHPALGFWPFIANLFLVQAWNLFDRLTWNGVAWFVSVEFFLCLIFPIYITIARGGWWRGVLLIVAGGADLLWLILTNKHGLDLTFHNSIFRGMGDFAIGVGLSNIYRHIRARGGAPAPEWFHSLLQAIATLVLLITIYHFGWSHQWRDIYVVPAMAFLIFVLAFDRGFLARALDTGPLQKIGTWSYAIYLGQTAWLQILHIVEARLYPAPDAIVLGQRWADLIWWPEPICLLVICTIWGALLATFVEEPANKRLRKYILPRAKTAAA